MRRLTLMAGINSYTGYGMHAIQIARDLEALASCHVSIRALSQSEQFGAKIPTDIRSMFVNRKQPEEWELLLHPPNTMPTPGKSTVFFTMNETTKLSRDGLDYLNMAHHVIVPCKWNADCFKANGVTAHIHIVPLGINTEVFSYVPPPESDVTTFGTAGRMAHGGVRKGINDVIETFLKTFPNDPNVCLKVKCFPDCDVSKVSDPRIEITQAYLSEKEMAAWISSLDCFVSAARGEGWGLIQHQAMAMGRAVMSVNYGGVTEFFNDLNGIPIHHKLVPATGSYTGMGDWAEPDFEHLSYLMGSTAINKPLLKAKGDIAAKNVKHLSWKYANRHLASLLRECNII